MFDLIQFNSLANPSASITQLISQVETKCASRIIQSTGAGQRRLKNETPSYLLKVEQNDHWAAIQGKEIFYLDEKTGTHFCFNEKTSTLSFYSKTGSNLRPEASMLIELMTSLKPKNLALGWYFQHGIIYAAWNDDINERKENFNLLMEALPNSSVTSLSLAFCNLHNRVISDQEIANLARVLPQSEIRELDLRGLSLSNEAAKSLAEALPKSKITKLNAALNDFGDMGICAIGEALPTSQIEELDLNDGYSRNTRLSSEALRVFSACVRDSGLKKLNLSTIFLGSEKVKAISEMIQHSKLEEISLYLGQEGVESFVMSLEGSAIKKLTLSPHSLGNRDLIKIAKAAAHSNLEEICFSGYGAIWVDRVDEINEFIDALTHSTHLKKIDLGTVNGFSDEIKDDIRSKLQKFNIEIEMWDRDIDGI